MKGRKPASRWRQRLSWYVPLGILPIIMACALAAWCLTTPTGSRWTLTIGANLFGVRVQNVSGTLWQGIKIGRLQWAPAPALSLHAQDVVLRVDWRALWAEPTASASLAYRHLRMPDINIRHAQLAWTGDAPGLSARSVAALPAGQWWHMQPPHMPQLPLPFSLEHLRIQTLTLQAPTAEPVTVQDIHASLSLNDQGQGVLTLHQAQWLPGGQIQAALDWQALRNQPITQLTTRVQVQDLPLHPLLQAFLAAQDLAAAEDMLSAGLSVSARWQGEHVQLSVQTDVAPQSRWLGQPVQAKVLAQVRVPASLAQTAQWQGLEMVNLNVDAALGQVRGQTHAQAPHTLRVRSRLEQGNANLALVLHSPDLSALWPDWRGSVQLDSQLESLNLQRWRGQLNTLALDMGDFQFAALSPVNADFNLDAAGEALQWRVHAFSAGLTVGTRTFALTHQTSTGNATALQMQGEVAIDPTMLPAALARELPRVLPGSRLPFELTVRRQTTRDALHHLIVDAKLHGAGVGQAQVSANASLAHTAEQGWHLHAPLTWQAQADMPNLEWLNALLDEQVQVGGRLQARLHGSGGMAQPWDVVGTLSGQQIRLLRLDDGVRLLDGTLQARLENQRLILEHLRFAAVPRVQPAHAPLRLWLRQEQAQGGYLQLSGSWPLGELPGSTPPGRLDITLHRYPIVQRSERYAMVSGTLHLALPAMVATPLVFTLDGTAQLDAGWLDLDALGNTPVLDDDVVIVRGNQAPTASSDLSAQFSMALNMELGTRFYVIGQGVDTRLTGALKLALQDNKLSARGVLRPPDGRGVVSAYGQQLHLREDSRIIFESDITNPVLSVEAVREGATIQAGVRVAGTPRRPRITLISYPEVNDAEKLAWLLFGRGADESGGDAALLLSAGSSFLLDGEPFYRRFGIDELGMRSGSLGSVGSVLPVESVVRGFDGGTSDIERKFVVASKHLGERLTASVEQALSDTGTVGRLAWRLGRGVSTQLTGGTVNGLALIYHLVLEN